jgi:hypothetical protein
MAVLYHHYALWEENITPVPPFQATKVSVSIMSWSLPHLEVYHNLLYDLPKIPTNDSTMLLCVWRFGWGRYTARERYGTVLHGTSNCGDNCWIEHGIQVVCPSIIYERSGWGRSYRYRLLWNETENNSTVGKKTFEFGRKCSWWRSEAPLCQFPVFPAICHMPTVPKRAENKKRLLNPVCYDSEHAN